MRISLDYKPTKKQKIFHKSTADEILYGGAAGGGKSYAICWDAFIRCIKYPGTRAYLFRRTYPELKQTLIAKMLQIVPKELGKYRASDHVMQLVNGSMIYFCHLSDEGKGTKAERSSCQLSWQLRTHALAIRSASTHLTARVSCRHAPACTGGGSAERLRR